MVDRTPLKRWFAIAIALLGIAWFVARIPTSRIYLSGARHTHLKSGEWVMAGPSTRLTDARFARLVDAINDRGDISCMRISNPNITSSGFSKVRELHTLHWLFIEDATLGDDALLHLRSLKNLRKLYFDRCPNLTPESIEQLRDDLPDCIVYIDAYT